MLELADKDLKTAIIHMFKEFKAKHLKRIKGKDDDKTHQMQIINKVNFLKRYIEIIELDQYLILKMYLGAGHGGSRL